ncbi:hypothetical protein LVJ94_35410 [Pendulispora rubella]|uniref:Uncharacterized protein n=1 Tax=Pendulispora rubella TaxID=2741070 RepID=A0ABZ2KUK1_9BACT
MADSSASGRTDRLDELLAATHAWAIQRRAALQNRLDSSKRILQGRSGSERLAQASVQAASELVVDEITDFLVSP